MPGDPDDLSAMAVLDCIGLLCPVPIFRTAQALDALAVGQVIEVVADDPAIVDDLPAWCEATGHHIVDRREDDRVWRYWVQKAD